MICALVENDITPYIFFGEGKYHQRLDIISDVPPGKVIYTFEDVDMRKAKRNCGKSRLHWRKPTHISFSLRQKRTGC